MATFECLHFEGREVPLDGNQFRGCDFVGVTFVFEGVNGFEIDRDCTFAGQIRLNIGAQARPALIMLAQMLNGSTFGVLVRRAIEHELAKGPDSFE